MFVDAKAAYRARNALALLIEQDLQLARWLAGLHGVEARRDVSELVSSMVETGHMLPLLEDRLLTIIEASQVAAYCPLGRPKTISIRPPAVSKTRRDAGSACSLCGRTVRSDQNSCVVGRQACTPLPMAC